MTKPAGPFGTMPQEPQALSYKKDRCVVLRTPKHHDMVFRCVTHYSPEIM